MPAQKVGDWPPYCSYMVFELLGPATGSGVAKGSGGGQQFVRVVFNGHALVLPGQATPLCPLGAFERLVEVEQAPPAAELRQRRREDGGEGGG